MNDHTERYIQQVLRGETQLFRAIVKQYQRDIWRLMAFGLQDRATTEDLVQQTFVNAYFKLHTFQAGRGRDFGAWLRTIARNLLRRELRRLSRRQHKLEVYHHMLCGRLKRHRGHDDADKLKALLEECEEELSVHAKKALDLRYRHSLSFGEIARRLNRTIAASRQLLQRTRSILRTCIEERMEHS